MRFRIALLCSVLSSITPVAGQTHEAPEATDDLAVVEQQIAAEALMREALLHFRDLTEVEFAALPPAVLQRQRFVWEWTAHYVRARLQGDVNLPSVPSTEDPDLRDRLRGFDGAAMRSGMRTEGVTRAEDPALPPVLRECADVHERVHERDLYAQAMRLARAHVEELVDAGTLDGDPAYQALVTEGGREFAIVKLSEEYYTRDWQANKRFVGEQRANGQSGPVRMLDGPLRDANVYYGHVDRRLSSAENFLRMRNLAEYELRAYEASSACLEAKAAELRAQRHATEAGTAE